jgi:hypothetical protein
MGCRLPLALDTWEKTVGAKKFVQFEENLRKAFMLRCPCKLVFSFFSSSRGLNG